MGAQALVVPTIFSVIDDVSPRLNAMQHNVSAFGTRSENAVSRADRAFRRLTPGLGAVQSQLLSMVGTGALLAGGVQLGAFSFNSAADYESAVDQFRVIVSDLNDADFKPFQDKIDQVARETKRSGTEVAQAFEKIAGINSTFAQTSEGLGQVTAATITLAKASKMDLGVAAENLVGIMNQFSFSADKADRTINALAAGQAVGAANITQTAEAFTVFGAIASGANITLEQSVGLIQTLGKYSLYGAEAGTKLRGVILRLQKAGIGYASGQFNVNDALNQTNEIIGKLKNSKQKDMLVNKLFGVENVTAGKILLKNVDTYQKFTTAVTGTQEAQKGAAINSGNLRTALSELSAAWVNTVTGTDGAKDSISQLSNGIHFITENLGTIINVGMSAGKALLYFGTALVTIKGFLMATSIATTALNVAIGVGNALFTRSTVLTYANATAQKAYAVTSIAAGTALDFLNAPLATMNALFLANPVGAVVLGISALAAAVGYLTYHQSQLNEEYERQQNQDIANHISAQSKATSLLAKQWENVGKNTHDAIVLALQYQLMQANQGLQSATAKQAETESKLFQATDEAWFPAFSPEVSRLRNELQENKSKKTLAMADKLGATNSVISAANSGIISGLEGGRLLKGSPVGMTTKPQAPQTQVKELDAASQSNISQIQDILKASMKMELTVKNDSNNPVSMQSGSTKTISVQPQMESTKVLRPAYGR